MRERSKSPFRLLFVVAALIVVGLSAFLLYKSRFGPRAKGIGLLAPPPAEQIKFSDYQPQNPFNQISPGTAAKTIFTTEENPTYRIEVRQIIIAPGQRSANVPLQGAAVVEVLDGVGAARVGQNRQEIKPNSAISVAEGESLILENNGDSQLLLRIMHIKIR